MFSQFIKPYVNNIRIVNFELTYFNIVSKHFSRKIKENPKNSQSQWPISEQKIEIWYFGIGIRNYNTQPQHPVLSISIGGVSEKNSQNFYFP
jgi:hypothetical protein